MQMLNKEMIDMRDIEARSLIETLKDFGYEKAWVRLEGKNRNPTFASMILVKQ